MWAYTLLTVHMGLSPTNGTYGLMPYQRYIWAYPLLTVHMGLSPTNMGVGSLISYYLRLYTLPHYYHTY